MPYPYYLNCQACEYKNIPASRDAAHIDISHVLADTIYETLLCYDAGIWPITT